MTSFHAVRGARLRNARRPLTRASLPWLFACTMVAAAPAAWAQPRTQDAPDASRAPGAAPQAAPILQDDRSTAASGAGALPLWEVGAGIALLRLPHYRGSTQSRNWALPVPFAVYRGDIFKADRDGARAELVKSKDWHLDFSVAAGAPTNSEDNTARSGMRDLAPTIELGPNFTWKALRGNQWDVELRVPVRAAATIERSPRYAGIVASPNVNLDVRLGDWNVGGYVAALYGSRRQNAYYYEVSAADATALRPAFRASGGYAGLQFVGGVSRRFGDLWVGAFARIDDLNGASLERSPLVGKRHSAAFGLGFSWVFAKSAQPAPRSSDAR